MEKLVTCCLVVLVDAATLPDALLATSVFPLFEPFWLGWEEAAIIGRTEATGRSPALAMGWGRFVGRMAALGFVTKGVGKEGGWRTFSLPLDLGVGLCGPLVISTGMGLPMGMLAVLDVWAADGGVCSLPSRARLFSRLPSSVERRFSPTFDEAFDEECDGREPDEPSELCRRGGIDVLLLVTKVLI